MAIKQIPIASDEEAANGWVFDTDYIKEIIGVMQDEPMSLEQVDDMLDILEKRGHIVKGDREK